MGFRDSASDTIERIKERPGQTLGVILVYIATIIAMIMDPSSSPWADKIFNIGILAGAFANGGQQIADIFRDGRFSWSEVPNEFLDWLLTSGVNTGLAYGARETNEAFNTVSGAFRFPVILATLIAVQTAAFNHLDGVRSTAIKNVELTDAVEHLAKNDDTAIAAVRKALAALEENEGITTDLSNRGFLD